MGWWWTPGDSVIGLIWLWGCYKLVVVPIWDEYGKA
jgi:hypothetical protein